MKTITLSQSELDEMIEARLLRDRRSMERQHARALEQQRAHYEQQIATLRTGDTTVIAQTEIRQRPSMRQRIAAFLDRV